MELFFDIFVAYLYTIISYINVISQYNCFKATKKKIRYMRFDVFVVEGMASNMKRILFVLCIIVNFIFVNTHAYGADEKLNFIDIQSNYRSTYAITDTGELYRWGEVPIYFEQGKSDIVNINTPELYEYGIKDFMLGSDEPVLLKHDGSVWYKSSELLPKGSADKLCVSYFLDTYIYMNEGDLFAIMSRNDSPIFIAENVKSAKTSTGYMTFVLDNNGDLWKYSSLWNSKFETEEPELLLSGVKEFDVDFANKTWYTTTYLAIKDDASLWRGAIDVDWEPYEVMAGAKTVRVSSPYYYVIDENDNLWETFAYPDEKYIDHAMRFVLKNTSLIATAYQAHCAIDNDNVIWYWGDVFLDPDEHMPYSEGYETRFKLSDPVKMSFDKAENDDQSHKRLVELLEEAEDSGVYLERNYDYFAENYPELFTAEQFEQYKEYSENYQSEKILIEVQGADVDYCDNDTSKAEDLPIIENVNEHAAIENINGQATTGNVHKIPVLLIIVCTLSVIVLGAMRKKR